MRYTILDCYTDEPAGLGVPPYLGTYPRYLAGYLLQKGHQLEYINIDDLRLYKIYKGIKKEPSVKEKTNIRIYNTTGKDADEILNKTEILIIILGCHVPGKYLSALPGTLREITPLISELKCIKILTGPAVHGTQLEGGKFFEKIQEDVFDEIMEFNPTYEEIADYAIRGSQLAKQIPQLRIMEIETSRGCPREKGCSFCTEILKSPFIFRKTEDIIAEIKKLYSLGQRYFRLGKQSCFYSHPDPVNILKKISKSCPDIKVLHIDNVNPVNVVKDEKDGAPITKAIVKYCTSGNIAAFGAESFDPDVYEQNNLNSDAETTYNAVKILNRYGRENGENGMPMFLPGINILFGLKGETKTTHEHNMKWLNRILEEKLLIRRINVRQVSIFEGTALYEECGNKYIRKNKRYYWKWRNDIRQNIDNKMLKLLVPVGSILKDVYSEIYDGKTTFMRQVGTYPLIIGVKGRLPLNSFYNVKITGHMLRSIIGEII